jgi:hypothetical protein
MCNSIPRAHRRMLASRRRRQRSLLFASALVAASSPLAWGQTLWVGTTGSWRDASNWSNGIPSANEEVENSDAYVSNGGTAQIISANTVAIDLHIGADAAGVTGISGTCR